MAWIESNLEPDERIVYRARIQGMAWIGAVLWLLLVLGFGKLTGLASTELALTDKRILGRVGMFRRKYLMLPYKQVDFVRVRQGGLGKLIDYGSVSIFSKEGTKVTFHGIAEPIDIQMQIDDAVEMAVLGRKLSQVVMEM